MKNSQIRLYYIIILLFLLIFLFYFNITEFFTIKTTYQQQSPTIVENTIVENTIDNVVLHDLKSLGTVHTPSLNENITSGKPISLRDDEEFQASIARMEDLVEYSRSNNSTEQDIVEFTANVDYTFGNSFDQEFDLKLTDKKSLEIQKNIKDTVAQKTTVVNLNNEPSINNEFDRDIDIESESSIDNFPDLSNVNFDLTLESSDSDYTDYDSDSDYQSSYIPQQKSVFEGMDISKMDPNAALKIFLDKTSEDLNLPKLKSHYTNEELGLGRPNLHEFPFKIDTSSRTRSSTESVDSTFVRQSNLSRGTNYSDSYLGSLNDSTLDRILNINSNNTLNTNEINKETSNVSDTSKSTTTPPNAIDRNNLKKKRMNQEIFKRYGIY